MKYAYFDPGPIIASLLRKPTSERARQRRTHHEFLVLRFSLRWLLLRHCRAEVGHRNRPSIITALLSQSHSPWSLCIHDRHLVHYRVLKKHDDLPPPYAE